jgi:Xaa-Pro aminopeptidase
LIGSAANRRWLSGFTGSTGWLMVSERSAVLGTDFRYWDQAKRQAPAFELVNFRSGAPAAWATFLRFDRPTRLGIESRHLTLAQYQEFKDVEKVTFVELPHSLEAFREVKNDWELATIRQAATITDAVMVEVIQIARIGQTELQLAWELERRLRERGATGLAFPIIVAFGENSAMAHHQPGERELRAGDPIIVDMGAELQGYASDLTRSFIAAAELDGRYREIYELVRQAQKTALEGISAGVSGKEADSLARRTIADGGYGEAFGHSLGHGLGLDVHEGPSLSQLHGSAPLRENSVVTVEPGIYLPDWGGVRIEDLVRITAEGVELLSHCPKRPAIAI